MFTGLIEAVGRIEALEPRDGGVAMTISSPWTDLAVGESIAVDGACLTVERTEGTRFTVKVVATSLPRTTFGTRVVGDAVNLERALKVGDRLGGHWVQGHVDGVGTVRSVMRRDDAVLVDIALPEEVATVTIPLGSIAVDGVSLTVNAVLEPAVVQVSIIPHTLVHTTLGRLESGARVHLEGDLVGKYLKGMATAWNGAEVRR